MIAETTSSASPSLLDGLANLWAVRYRVTLTPRGSLVLPFHGRGAVLRGGFLLSFRKLVCHDLDLDCRACPLEPACPYPEVCAPAPPAGCDRLSGFSDLPRPFVIDPPPDEEARFSRGRPLAFGLTVVGRASRHAPYFVVALRALADEGLGPRRGCFDLDEVAAIAADGAASAIYRGGERYIRLHAPPLRARDLVREGDGARGSVTLRFSTPLEVKDGGAPVSRPLFGAIVRRLRDRLNALSSFFADGPLSIDFRGVSAAADTVRLVEDRTRRIAIARGSRRTGQSHDIGGFIGEARYEGDAIGALMPLLRLGELLHVGKHAAFGNGRIEVLP